MIANIYIALNYAPGAVLSTDSSTHLILTTARCNRCYHHHFTDEETEARGIKVTWLVGGRARTHGSLDPKAKLFTVLPALTRFLWGSSILGDPGPRGRHEAQAR